MTTFSTRILQCPNCENKMYTYQLNSYTVHSSTVYSDGKIVCNPPILFEKEILICTDCDKAFWRDDAMFEDEDYSLSNDELPNAIDVHDLMFAFDSDFSTKLSEYYSNLLVNGFANTIDREIYLRTELWQLLNNSKRNKPNNILSYIKRSDIKELISRIKHIAKSDKSNNLFIGNLKKLISIYKANEDEELLLLAEMHRELGNHSKASSLLKSIKNIDKNGAYKKIQKANNRKNTKVFKLN